jgi:hypothetical protein
LTNGNYVVGSSNWNNNTGAATWGNGSTGVSGTISSTNSLIGSTANLFGLGGDNVSGNGIIALTNGNYVVASSGWANNSSTSSSPLGAATWGNGLTGISGTVSAANSLIGSNPNDRVSSNGITALTNGNYVVASPNWTDNACGTNVGAATWGNGTTGVSGTVSSTNSLIGSTAGDNVSGNGITALTNGNYVVGSANWDRFILTPTPLFITNAGAATWGNGSAGTAGIVSDANSLVGSTAGDFVSNRGITALTNGNYVVASANWNNGGTAASAGAATWGNGTGGTNGAVTSTNSLVGSTANDFVSGNGITTLTNGNYVVASANWNNSSTAPFAGAATWGNGTGGTNGAVTSTNSLVGSSANDFVSNSGITALTNGNYVVRSSSWNNGSLTGAGAATWGNGLTGISGTVSGTNSLIGSSANDNVSGNGIAALSNGNYVVSSPIWDNGTVVDAGAATWGNGTTGISGTINSINSLVGTTAGDLVSGGSQGAFAAAPAFTSIDGITALPNGNYVVNSIFWNNGTIASAGASTWGNGFTGINGIVSTINSLTGSATFDFRIDFGQNLVTGLSNGNYVLAGSYWDNAGLVDAGQVRIVTPENIFFANGIGQTMFFNPSTLAATLALGTNITLQASNDITLNAGTDIIVGGNNGGAFTLQAGRNITLNSSIRTATGNFTAIAGDPNAIAADRELGTPTITLGSGMTINVGKGKVILAAIGGNFVNNTGSITPINADQWLVYSTDPSLNAANGMNTGVNKHYAQTYTGSTPSYATVGNWFLYIITPTLTVTPSSETIVYGSTPSAFTPGFTGFIDGDTASTAGILGTPIYTIQGTLSTSGNTVAGLHNVDYITGLLSNFGYSFVNNAASTNELNIVKKDIAVTGVSAANKIYDSTTTATLSGVATITPIAADLVTLNSASNAGIFASPNAANNINVAVKGFAITGSDAANYNLIQPSVLANITPATLTAALIGNPTKVYDGNTIATLTAANYRLTGFIGTEGASVNEDVGNYNSANVLTANTVSANLAASDFAANSGTLLSNYNLPITVSGIGKINAATLTAALIGNPTKVYDDNTIATLTTANYRLTGFIGTEGASVNEDVGNYNSANVLTTNTVSVNLVASDFAANRGTLLSNYNLPIIALGAGQITPATLTYTANPSSRLYGTDNPVFTGTVTGFVSTDNEVNATTGTRLFTSTATRTSDVGHYAIDGSGLTANNGNYHFVQAASNKSALSITPAVVSPLQPTVNQDEPVIKINLANVELPFSQLTPLQSSTTFLYGYQEKPQHHTEDLELVELENGGIKLAKGWQMHIEFPVNSCAPTATKPWKS